MFTVPAQLPAQHYRRSYDALYRQGWLPNRRGLMRWISRRLDIEPGDLVLDIACGDAQLAPWITAMGGCYIGLDFALDGRFREELPKSITADAHCLPIGSQSIDLVTCIGSLEHFEHPALAIREMARVLKPGGRGCILVPNAFGLTWNLLHVWRTGRLADDGRQPLQRYGTRAAWASVLKSNGLVIEETLGFERALPLSRDEWRLYVRHPGEILLACLAPLLPLNLKRCFVFLCRPEYP